MWPQSVPIAVELMCFLPSLPLPPITLPPPPLRWQEGCSAETECDVAAYLTAGTSPGVHNAGLLAAKTYHELLDRTDFALELPGSVTGFTNITG